MVSYSEDLQPSAITLNRTLLLIRRQIGLSQKELATLLEIDYVWLSQLENGRVSLQERDRVDALLPSYAALGEVRLSWLRSLPLLEQPRPTSPAVFPVRVANA